MPPLPMQPPFDSLSASTGVLKPITRAVIPAAGFGTRLQPLTRALPKELLPIGREPVLAHIAAELREAGVTDALFIVSARKPQIRAYFGDVYDPDTSGPTRLPPLRCTYLEQQEQRGSGDAVLCAESWVGADSFVVAFGDSIIESPHSADPLKRLLAAHQAFGSSASALVEAIDLKKVSNYGVVAPLVSTSLQPLSTSRTQTFKAPFEIADIVEKPSVEDAPSNLVVAARWVFSPAIFAALRSVGMDARGELNIPDPVRLLLRTGHRACAAPLLSEEARRDIGNYESFFAQFLRAAMRDPDCGAAIRAVAEEELADARSRQ